MIATQRHEQYDIRKKLIFSICRYDVMFLLNKCEHHRHNNITKNRSQRRKNFRKQSATSTIFKMTATEQRLTVAKQEILTARIDEEALVEAIRCYPMLYDKSMKEFTKTKELSPAPFFTHVVMR